MNTREELALLNKEVSKEVKEFDELNRIIKHKKQRMYKLYAEQNRLWKKLIGEVKHSNG